MKHKITYIKSLTFIITFFGIFAFGFAQTCNVFDDFFRPDDTVAGGNWIDSGANSSIVSNELQIATGGVSGRDYIYQDVSSSYNTQLGSLPNIITWTFNMRQTRVDPSGFNTSRYGVAFVLGGTSSDLTIGNGYAVVLGGTGAIDNVRLVSYTGGIDLNSNLTNIITGGTDFGDEYLSIKVTYASSTDTWELFVRNDGVAFADPATLIPANSQGTAIDATFIGSNLDYVAMFWNHATAGGDIASFDNLCINTAISCTTSTTWTAGAWDNGIPDIYTTVTIDDNYNTTANGSFNACNLTVNSGFTLSIANGDYIEIQNNIVADGNITVETQGAVVQIDDTGTVTGAGTITVIKTTAPSNAWYEYTYWSSPVESETIDGALTDADVNRRFWFDASLFEDSTMETGNNNATALGQDDIDDNGDDWQLAAGTDTMTPGVGYASTQSEFSWSIAPGTANKTFDYIFNGPFNNGVITVPVVRNDVETADTNWNFIGNPYPSAIDVDDFFSQNVYDAVLNPSGMLDGAIFLWSQNTPPDGGTNGNEGQNFAQSDYAIINGTGETQGGDLIPPNRFIPSGQGFFVSVADAPQPLASGDVIFNNSMRVTGSNDQFFRPSNSNLDNKLWVNLTSDNGVFNQALVGYVNGATNSYNGTYYDAPRNLSTGAAAILYTTIEGNTKKFAIQGKAENSLNEDEVIKLGFKTTIDVATLYTLSIAQFEGDFLNNNAVYLKDNLLNKLHNLKDSDYTFTSEVGEFNSRFEIVFNPEALSLGEHAINSDSLSIIELNNGNIQFKLSSPLELKSIEIIDLLGRTLYRLKANGNSKTYNLSNLSQATYIAKVELSNGVVITKKAVKRN
jgi:hypothetical protein